MRFLPPLICLALTLTAAAQTPPPPTTQPSLLNQMLQPPGNAPAPLVPVFFPPTTMPGNPMPPPPPPPLIREGTFLNRRDGKMIKSADGVHELLQMYTQGQPTTEPPYILLPNQKLESMEDALATAKRDLMFRVTGMVTEYHHQNYVLLETQPTEETADAMLGQLPATAPGAAPVVAAAPTSLPTTGTANDILNSMLSSANSAGRPVPVAVASPTTASGAVTPGPKEMSLLREGKPLVDVTGRMVPSADGQSETFVFESDGKAMELAPMTLLPCLKLETMEQAVAGANTDVRFRISGLVTDYHGRNYLLLEKVVVVPDVVQQF